MEYKYRGAEALIILHKKHLLHFYDVWKIAKEKNIVLPETDDLDYKSLETLLRHVLNSSGNYLIWICKQLKLEFPPIQKIPNEEIIDAKAAGYIDELLAVWENPLKDVSEEKYFDRTYKSNWSTEYCIEAMLEHAVMHPIRHAFQIENLLRE